MTISADRAAATSHIRFLRQAASVLVILLLFGIPLITWPPMLQCLAQAWAVSDDVKTADAAVVLGGGFETRPAAAARLYKKGVIKFILVSSAGIIEDGDPDINSLALLKLGIPSSAIIEFGDNPTDTYQEARALAAWAEHNQLTRVIVPTEIFPSRRVRWIFRRELGKVGVDARVKVLTQKYYGYDGWWRNKSGIGDFSVEIAKYLYYRVRYWRS